MPFTHRSTAKLIRYLLISLAGSALFQLIAMWSPLVWCAYAISILVMLVSIMLIVQYYGLFTDKKWAKHLTLSDLNAGLLQFVVILFFAVIGIVPTCFAYLM